MDKVIVIENTITDMDRTITFGKYKGQPIKKLIMEHIGYIMWCLSNISNFSLTDEEQAVYDAVAIGNVKYGIKMVFPNDAMLAHVKDKDRLEREETPFIMRGDGMIRFNIKDSNDPIIASIIHLFKIQPVKRNSMNFLPELSKVANKIIDISFPEFQGVDYDDF